MAFTCVLTDNDAAAFHQVRRRALQEEPEAFAIVPEEMRSVETLAGWFTAEADGQNAFVMRAFDSQRRARRGERGAEAAATASSSPTPPVRSAGAPLTPGGALAARAAQSSRPTRSR